MPTYQYLCTACAENHEVQQRFTDDALTVCPSCNGRLRKIFNAVGVVFKGSGFYKTDSRVKASSSNGSETGSSASSNDSASNDSTPSGDAKPAEKTGPARTNKPSAGSAA